MCAGKKKRLFFIVVIAVFAIMGIYNLTIVQTNVKAAKNSNSKILVAYFSRAGGNYSVGTIKKGNTKIVAEQIAKQTGGELFEIETKKAYPKNYKKCTAVAEEEQKNNARPELKSKIKNINQYDEIYLGYPIWYADMPMAVYTFLESYDWEGKTIHPFCTHEGSGLSGTTNSIKEIVGEDATVTKGFSIEGHVAQNSRAKTKKKVTNWIKQVSETTTKKQASAMSIIIDGKEYDVELNSNKTVDALIEMLPLDLDMEEFDEHEYYSELSEKPSVALKKTSKIKEGYIYYWDGWNAFVINYKDVDISPYKVVPIGKIKEKDIIRVLEQSEETISVKVKAK